MFSLMNEIFFNTVYWWISPFFFFLSKKLFSFKYGRLLHFRCIPRWVAKTCLRAICHREWYVQPYSDYSFLEKLLLLIFAFCIFVSKILCIPYVKKWFRIYKKSNCLNVCVKNVSKIYLFLLKLMIIKYTDLFCNYFFFFFYKIYL